MSNLREKVKDFFKRAKRVLFNRKWTCSICGEEIFDEGYLCETCKKEVPYVKTYCDHCGRKTAFDIPYCNTCVNRLVWVDKARSVFNYEYPINRLIGKFKNNRGKYLAEFFAYEMAKLYQKGEFNADFIVFVPMTKKAERKRGYNQSKLLAEELSKIIGVEVKDQIVEKVKETKNQKTLNYYERHKNLDGVFKINGKSEIVGKKIVIVDDVTTTGITAEKIAEKLKKKGASKVYLITVASRSIDNFVS